jgi:hypothetical protein
MSEKKRTIMSGAQKAKVALAASWRSAFIAFEMDCARAYYRGGGFHLPDPSAAYADQRIVWSHSGL